MAMKPIRILLADDHALVRTGIATLLQSNEDFAIVGEAGDGEEAIRLTKKLSPDVVVIDLSMPKISGVEAARTIRTECPKTRVLVLTMHENEEYVYQIFKA
ncbi:MAG: response regulator transcription factor, partial [Bacteroidota bacterium]